MFVFVFQVAATDGLSIDPAWLIATIAAVVSTLTGTIAVLYRGQVAALQARIAWCEEEGLKKDVRLDKLIAELHRTADVGDRAVSLVERERGTRR